MWAFGTLGPNKLLNIIITIIIIVIFYFVNIFPVVRVPAWQYYASLGAGRVTSACFILL